mgnify:CR=1 FL=1
MEVTNPSGEYDQAIAGRIGSLKPFDHGQTGASARLGEGRRGKEILSVALGDDQKGIEIDTPEAHPRLARIAL